MWGLLVGKKEQTPMCIMCSVFVAIFELFHSQGKQTSNISLSSQAAGADFVFHLEEETRNAW